MMGSSNLLQSSNQIAISYGQNMNTIKHKILSDVVDDDDDGSNFK